MSNLKIIKNIKIKWKWHGDRYLLRGFNLLLMNDSAIPNQNLSGVLASTVIPAINIDTNNAYEYTFNNITLDKGQSIVPWVQALYDNSDSEWVSMDGAIVEDDGNATIVVIGNPTFQQVIDMADDSKITPQEKLSLEKEWDELVTDHYLTLLGVEKAALDSMHPDVRNYDDKIDLLAAYLNYNNAYTFHPLNHAEFAYPSMITDKLTTDLNTLHYGGPDKYKKVFRDFYDAKVKLLETIKDAILKNNNDLIQDEIDKNTLPTTIPLGGYTASYFEANKNYDSNLELGTVRIGIGHFITTTGLKYNIKIPETVVTNLNSNKTRTKYILFIGADKTRFEGMNTNFVSALPKNGEWYYFNGANDNYKTFKPIPEDCVVAKLEEHNSSSTVNGIRAIKYYANTQQSVFDQLTDGGEQQFIGKDENGRIFINGEYIQAHTIKGQHVIANGLKATSVEDGRTTFEITETGEAKLDVKNFTLRAGGEINMQGVVTFESLDKDMQGNFVQTGKTTTINGDAIKTGSLTANNNKSVFNLNDGTFRLGGTSNKDYKLYFDGTNLNFGDGVIQWPELPEIPDIPDLSDLDSFSITLSKDTHTIRVDKDDKPEPMEIGINGRAVTTITAHRNGKLLEAVPEVSEVLATNQFKYEIKRTINCVAKRRSDTEIYIESLMDNSGVLTLDGETGIIDIENIQSDIAMIDTALTEGGYIELDIYCGSKKQLFKKAISFSKIKAGQDGLDGQDGAAGEAAKYIKITGDQIFKYSPSNEVDKESIQLRATAYNFAPSKMIWEQHDGANWVQADGINNQTVYTVRHDSPDWKNRTQLRLRCIMEEMFIDEITLSKLSDGVDGLAYTVILSNEAHTIACDENGQPESGQIGITGLATTDVTVYRNTEKLEPVRLVGGDYNELRENEFALEIVEQVGCKASMTDADTIHITAMNSNSGYISLNIIADKQAVAMKKMSLTKAIKGKPGQDGVDGVGAYVAVLTNDFHSIPTDKNGNNGNFTGCETSIVIIHGENEVTEGVTYTAEPSSGVRGVLNNNVYTVTNMTTDSGYVDMTATINKTEYTKRFTLSKNKSGQDGESGTSIWILNDVSVIHKNKAGALVPNKIIFNAKSQKGTEDATDYLGKFLISTSTDGSTFTKAYESTTPESSYTFNLPNNIATVRCQLLKADTNSVIDEERIPVVSDGEKGDQGPVGPPGSDAEVPSWVDEWTSNSTNIGAAHVISPKIFAGVNKPNNGGKTGVALGRSALGGADVAENIGLGVYSSDTLIAKMYAVPVNGNVIEIGTGSTKMTVDINGNVSAPKMTANEIVSQINGGSTTISGNKITTGTITARHISSDGISVNYINANGVDPILKLFQQPDGSYCSLDATSYMESGRGNSIRLKWNSNNYVQIGQAGSNSPLFSVYMGDGNADDSKARLELKYDYFNVVRGPGESSYAVSFGHAGASFPGFNSVNCYNTSLITLDGAASAGTNTGIWLRHDQVRIGTNGAYMSTVGGAFRLYTTFDRDIGIRMSQDCKLLELKSNGVFYNGTQLGAQGERGPQGPQGPQGERGPRGYDGAPGTTNMEGLTGQVLQASYGWLYLCSSSYSSSYRFVVDTSEGYIFPYGNGGLSLGKSNTRFHGAYFVNSPNISSDSNLKKDILYIEQKVDAKVRKRRSIQLSETNIETPMILGKNDLYDFVKNDLKLAQYKLKASKDTDEETTTIGFIAQDIAYTKVGSILVQNQLQENEGGLLSYDSGAYMSIYGGALQVTMENSEINTKEIDILKQEVNSLKLEIENLKKIIKGEI